MIEYDVTTFVGSIIVIFVLLSTLYCQWCKGIDEDAKILDFYYKRFCDGAVTILLPNLLDYAIISDVDLKQGIIYYRIVPKCRILSDWYYDDIESSDVSDFDYMVGGLYGKC